MKKLQIQTSLVQLFQVYIGNQSKISQQQVKYVTKKIGLK